MKSPILLIILGVLLVCAIGLAVLVKPLVNNFEKHGRKPFFTAAFIIVFISLTGALMIFLFKDQPFTLFWVLVVMFLLFGALQLLLTHKQFFLTDEAYRNKNLAGEFVYSAATTLFSIVLVTAAEIFIFKYPDFLFYPVMLSCVSFIIPLLFITTINEAGRIPQSYFPVLEYPEISKESPDDNPNERLLVIGFELAKKSSETRSYFRARTPDDILLGDLFYFFINDYNESQSETPIQYRDENNNGYKWWFRLKPKWYQSQRVLDPAQSMKENNVVENSIIICERL